MHRSLHFGMAIAVSALVIAGCGGVRTSHDAPEHTAHTAAGHAAKSGIHDTHEAETGHAHNGEAADAHAGEGEIELTAQAIQMAGITLAKAGTGTISGSIDLSGEIGFNEDKLVHITPRFAGIAKEVKAKIGDFVNPGDIVAVIESNESMSHYSLKAPIAGRIIDKHITLGEHVSEEESIYLLADLSTVWVNLAVYPKDASKVKPGQKVSIVAVGSDNATAGTIQYVTPVIDAQTRRITARIVLPNIGNLWRPGTFVNARIEESEGKQGVVVEKEAVQILDNKTVIFISDEPNCFKPVEVVTGESDSRQILILGGIDAGSEYVNKGAFELKAMIVTSSLGSHAGHGH